jgi:hypothetical protein
MPTEDFLAQRIHIWQIRAIGNIGKPILPDDPVEFSLRLSLNIRIEAHCEEKSLQLRRGLFKVIMSIYQQSSTKCAHTVLVPAPKMEDAAHFTR